MLLTSDETATHHYIANLCLDSLLLLILLQFGYFLLLELCQLVHCPALLVILGDDTYTRQTVGFGRGAELGRARCFLARLGHVLLSCLLR